MRIPSLDLNIKSISDLTIDPKTIALIENLGKTPLLIEKITLNSQAQIQLKVQGVENLKTIDVPISLSKELAAIISRPSELSLSISNNQIVLKLSTILQQETLTVAFKQAALIEPDRLQLTQRISAATKSNIEMTISGPSSSAISSSGPSSSGISKALPLANLTPTIKNTEDMTLKEAISHFLKHKAIETPSVSTNLEKLLSTSKKLITTMNSPLQTITSSPIKNSDQQAIQGRLGIQEKQPQQTINFGKAELTEILAKLGSLTPKNTQLQHLQRLVSSLDSLKQTLDFSVNNRQLNLKQRITSNGSFLESQLAKNELFVAPKVQVGAPTNPSNTLLQQSETNKTNDLTKITLNSPLANNSVGVSSLKNTEIAVNNIVKSNTQLPQNKAYHASQETLPDLKLRSISLKQTLESMLSHLMSPQAKPIITPQLLEQILNHPAYLKLFNQPEAITSPHVTIPTDSDESSLLSFSSANLRNIFSTDKIVPQLPQILLNNKQEMSLLVIQRQLINDMLIATSAIVDKIETNQLLSLRSETPLLQQFLLELPIHQDEQIDSFELLFEKKQNDEEEEANRTWSVVVRFDLQPLGPMFAKITLRNNRISTHFFAEQAETAKLLSENMTHLKNSLFAAGLDIEEISGQQGVVPDKLLSNDELTIDLHV